MPTPLKDSQVLATLTEPYQQIYNDVRKTCLQPQESVYAAAHCTWLFMGKDKPVGYEQAFLVVTSFRFMRVRIENRAFRWDDAKVVYRSKLIPKILLDQVAYWVFVFPPEKPHYAGLVETSLLEAAGTLLGKNRYTCRKGRKKFDIVELFWDNTWLVFCAEDGDLVYYLLQAAKQNQGRILSEAEAKQQDKPTTPAHPNLAEQLEKLAELNRYQVITDEEYEEAKRRLLS